MGQDIEVFTNLRDRWSRLGVSGKVILGALALVAIALPALWIVDRLLLLIFARSYVDEIAQVFNLDHYMARAISLVIWVIAGFFISRLFSISPMRRKVGFYGLVGLFVAHAIVLSIGSKGQYFEASTGKATKCYVLTRSGEVNYLERPGVDPVTGRVCRTYTPEIAERLQAYSQGKRPERIIDAEPVFFDLRTGEPIVWYWKDKDGFVELFNLMGFHPESGEELVPVTADIARTYKSQAHRQLSPPRRVTDIENYQLFDTATGRPRVWFWRGANGEYEFFDNQGFHPASGDALKLFNADEIAHWKQEQRLAKEYAEQEEQKRIQAEQLRRDAEERRIAREKAQAEQAAIAENERQAQRASAVDRCDSLAANPHDPRKPDNILGARFSEVKDNADQALAACRIAVEMYPDDPRYKYQYARALGFSRPDEAIKIYRNLTKQIYPAAFDNLASLLLQRNDKKSIKDAVDVLKDGVRHRDPDSMVTLAALAGTTAFPVQNPYNYRLMLYKQAASLGNADAKDAADALEQQLRQQQQEYINQREQERMMLEIFGGIVGGALRAR